MYYCWCLKHCDKTPRLTRVVGFHEQSPEVAGEEEGAAAVGVQAREGLPVRVEGVHVALGAHGHHVPRHPVALAHGQPREMAVHVAVDSCRETIQCSIIFVITSCACCVHVVFVGVSVFRPPPPPPLPPPYYFDPEVVVFEFS